jgi:hypothetical protein
MVWIHERHIHKAARVPKSEYFGRWHALSSIITTITNGCGGNKRLGTRVVIDAEYAGCNFSITSGTNSHRVAFVSFGQMESFSAGDSNGDLNKIPRWFRFGTSTYCDIATQLAIVSDAIGDDSSLDNDVRERRKLHAKNYCKGVDAGVYKRIDVPMIAYKYCNQLSSIFKSALRHEHVLIHVKTDEVMQVDRRAFSASELDQFEEALKLMIISSTTTYGDLRVERGNWSTQLSSSSRSSSRIHFTFE